ncbi:hypothetical protein [Botrimarina sp.]|uniref:hypothetical protein n=1 Tax=Botrimarina sp. TaxID=2795802 RepID=UPI0032ED2BD8
MYRTLAAAALAVVLVAAQQAQAYLVPGPYQVHYDDGYQAGYDFGFAEAFPVGAARGVTEGTADGDAEGYSVGYDETYYPSYSQAYDEHFGPAYDAAYAIAYDAAYPEGHGDGADYVRELVATNELLVVTQDGTVLSGSFGFVTTSLIDDGFSSLFGAEFTSWNSTLFGSVDFITPAEGVDPSQHYYDLGFEVGEPLGRTDGDEAGYESTYDAAFAAGYEAGLVTGREEGVVEGLLNGAADGTAEGTEAGESVGDIVGYRTGVDDGVAWAWGQLEWTAVGSIDLGEVRLAAPAYFAVHRDTATPEPTGALLLSALALGSIAIGRRGL